MDCQDEKSHGARETELAKGHGAPTAVGVSVATASTENDPNDGSNRQLAPEHRTTALTGSSCGGCGKPLTGRKRLFCSDSCRMKVRRSAGDEQVSSLLKRLEAVLCELRAVLHIDVMKERG
jgi:hypothetical protein